jgi:hypothetical protein
LSQNLDIFELLTKTYPRYVDNVSREAVEAVFVDLIRRDELRGIQQKADNDYKLGVTEQVLGWLNAEVDQISGRGQSRFPLLFSMAIKRMLIISSSYSPADVFVLLCWTARLYIICLSCNPDFPSSQSWNGLVQTMATLYNLVFIGAVNAKPSIRKASLMRTRRALGSVRLTFYY